MVKSLVILATLLALAACAPPQSRFTRNGEPCHPIGYAWDQYWVSPDGKTWCAAQ
jgi:hypothetical protein